MLTAPSEEWGSFPALGSHSAMEILLLCGIDHGLLHSLEHSEAAAASLALAWLEIRRGQLQSAADGDKASLRVTSSSW